METPTAAPAAPAPAPSAPAPSAPASAPAVSSPPSSPTRYGDIKGAGEIWAQLEKDAAIKTPSEEQQLPGETLPPDQPPVDSAAPPIPPEPAIIDPLASPNEATLPPKLRDSLKTIADPKVRAYLADAAHMRATLSKTQLPFAQIEQFIADAPQYLAKAPTLDVLNQIVSTAEQLGTVGSDFTSGTEEGHQRFTQSLLQAGPEPFVQYLGFLFNNTDKVIGGLRRHYGDELGRQVQEFTDDFRHRGNQNLIARMRSDAGKGGDFEVLGEVADELEKYLGLKERAAAKATPAQPDPRDLRIMALETERQKAIAAVRESFDQSVFSQSGTVVDGKIKVFIDQKGSGFSKAAQAELVEAIGTMIYSQLLNNKAVVARAEAIRRAGKQDAAHAEQLVNFYVNAADRLLGVVAPPILRRMAELTGASLVARQQRVAAQVARKDPGASGSPARTAIPELPKTSSPKDIFAHLDKLAEARAGGG